MQGYDFAALKASGDALARRHVLRLVTEVWRDDISTYQGTENDLCRDWLPFMTSIGYELAFFQAECTITSAEDTIKNCQEQLVRNPHRPKDSFGLKEGDAYWRLASLVSSEGDSISLYKYPLVTKVATFSEEEYASCINNVV